VLSSFTFKYTVLTCLFVYRYQSLSNLFFTYSIQFVSSVLNVTDAHVNDTILAWDNKFSHFVSCCVEVIYLLISC